MLEKQAEQTWLLLNVEAEFGYNYTLSGKLTSDGMPVSGRKVAVKVNGTVLGASTTASDGSFTGTLTLPGEKNGFASLPFFYGSNFSLSSNMLLSKL